ncbi:sugar kinase [Clostridium isatidis]|uniref:2-keto-3-deoxygluconate kinase n=1 Tax=Clostridium isatidis TaxID=182773 RepID=A0A343JDI0_9CLOT|nr:sugar kinase [Clostridium isatidis]ASW43588.1 2-keto-3-deoxygluconate kinase [Clostridium isatidis]
MKKLDLKKGKIFGFGEIMLRLTPTNYKKISQASEYRGTYGGGEANVISSLSMFGHDTKFVTKLPNNNLGFTVENLLKSNGVDTKEIIFGEGRLGVYFFEMGHGYRVSEVTYDRKYSAISLANRKEFELEKILQDVGMLVISGITPAISKEMRSFTVELIKKCKENNILVCFDSNYRAKMWSLEEAKECLEEILPLVDVAFLGIKDITNILKIKVNESNDFDKSLLEAYKILKEIYPNIKYMSSTRRNVNSINNNSLKGYIFDGEKLYSSKEYTFDILDRVGTGDSFTAGIIHGLLSYDNFEKIVEFGTVASVLKHSIIGDMNQVTEKEVLSLVEEGLENIKR